MDIAAFLTINPQFCALKCDAWHHHYHYQSSAQYLWLAETLRAMALEEQAQTAYSKAIFQDHLNAEALTRKQSAASAPYVPNYDSHPLLDATFCAHIGKAQSPATALHDEAAPLIASDNNKALALLDKAIAADAEHANSYFARGKRWFAEGEYEKARADFEEAIRLSHIEHEQYHRIASEEHLTRARKFYGEGELDLALTDCTKALDLNRTNKQALKLRAQAYRDKGSVKLAEEDEADFDVILRTAKP